VQSSEIIEKMLVPLGKFPKSAVEFSNAHHLFPDCLKDHNPLFISEFTESIKVDYFRQYSSVYFILKNVEIFSLNYTAS